MKRPYNLYGRFNELKQVQQNDYMANRLITVKPMINLKCPESYIFFKKKFVRNLPDLCNKIF